MVAALLEDPRQAALAVGSMTRLAGEAINRFPRADRNFSSSTVSLSMKTYHEIIELIRNTRQAVLKKVGEEPSPEPD